MIGSQQLSKKKIRIEANLTSIERAAMSMHTRSTRQRAKINVNRPNSVSFERPGASQRSKHSISGARNVTSTNRKVPTWSKRRTISIYGKTP